MFLPLNWHQLLKGLKTSVSFNWNYEYELENELHYMDNVLQLCVFDTFVWILETDEHLPRHVPL
jgi:hypothetical protein